MRVWCESCVSFPTAQLQQLLRDWILQAQLHQFGIWGWAGLALYLWPLTIFSEWHLFHNAPTRCPQPVRRHLANSCLPDKHGDAASAVPLLTHTFSPSVLSTFNNGPSCLVVQFLLHYTKEAAAVAFSPRFLWGYPPTKDQFHSGYWFWKQLSAAFLLWFLCRCSSGVGLDFLRQTTLTSFGGGGELWCCTSSTGVLALFKLPDRLIGLTPNRQAVHSD